MIAQADTRTALNAFFRQRRKFLLFFLPVLFAGLFYVSCLASAEYESTAKILVRFGADARPEISQAAPEGSSADEHHELVQSNVNILTSRDLMEALLGEVTIERAYPQLALYPPARGTLMDAAVKRLGDDLSVKTEAESDILAVSLFNPDPETARLMLGKLLDLFVAKQSEIYANPQVFALKQQADSAHEKLEDAQKRMGDFKTQTGIVSFDDELGLLLKQRSNLAEDLLSKQRSYAHYQSLLKGKQPEDADAKAIEGQIAGLDTQVSAMTQRKAQYDDLTREIQMDEDGYKEAQERKEAAEANQTLNQQKITRISIIEHPALPYKPARPWKAAILALSLLAGLALGSAACLLAERFDQSFSMPEQAAAALGVPVLASFAYRAPPTIQTGVRP